MKRIIFLGLVLVSLVGCSRNDCQGRNDCPIIKVGNKVAIDGFNRAHSYQIKEISGRWFKDERGWWWNTDSILGIRIVK